VITSFAQKEQVISAAFGLDYREQQSLLAELGVEIAWQIERSGSKDGAIVGS
jgi:hypothetical protein